MASKKEKLGLYDYWNSKGIVVHKRITRQMSNEMAVVLKDYTVDEVKEMIDTYATILEPGVPAHEKKYWWTHKWNFYEFLARGVKKFYGQDPENFRKNQKIDAPEAVVFTRKM